VKSDISFANYARLVVLTAGVITVFVSAAATLIYAADIFLVLILAILFGVFLSRCSNWIAKWLPVGYGWSLGIVTTVLVLLSIGGLLLFGVQINSQVEKAIEHFGVVERQIKQLAGRYPALETALQNTPIARNLVEDSSGQSASGKNSSSTKSGGEAPDKTSGTEDGAATDKSADEKNSDGKKSAGSSGKGDPKSLPSEIKSVASRVGATLKVVLTSTMGLFVNSLVIFFVGLFLAVAPDKYRDGVARLFPPQRRQRVCELLDGMGDTLWQWLVGRFGSMLVTGVGAGIILWVLGVPLAISLGVLTALLTFIPNIGGFLALTMSVLCAVPLGGSTVAMVIAGYLLLQLVESYVVTPLIQQHQVSLPPALLIAFQALMGVLFGLLGAAVASPVLAAAKYLVQEAYIKDVLENGEAENSDPDGANKEQDH